MTCSACPTLFALLLRLYLTRSDPNPRGRQLPVFLNFLQLESDKIVHYLVVRSYCFIIFKSSKITFQLKAALNTKKPLSTAHRMSKNFS